MILMFSGILTNSSGEIHTNPNQRITFEDVENTIKRLKSRLVSQIKASGAVRFPGLSDLYSVGITALCGYSLITAGIKTDNAGIQRMLRYCSDNMKANKSTYNLACCALFFSNANPVIYKDELELCRDSLYKSQFASGMWAYSAAGRDNRGIIESGDNSNTQFAILGLWACTQAGFSVPRETWLRAQKHYRKNQNGDGGWGYSGWARGNSYESMTAAAVASLWIIHEQLEGKHKHCENKEKDSYIEGGLDWIDGNFEPGHGISGSWKNYSLYAIERAGIITARRYFSDFDWYRAGAAYLVRSKFSQDISEDAFALLFLAKGKTPLIIQKLERDDKDWDNDHYDLENLTNYYTQQTGKKVAWQNARMRENAGDLLEAPILLVSGRKELYLSVKQRNILKEFLLNGGTVLAIPASESERWDKSFRKVMSELYPEAKLMQIAKDHPIYSHLFEIPHEERQETFGLYEGCSLKVLFVPKGAYTCKWTTENQNNFSFQMGVNILAFLAGDDGLKNRIDPVNFVPLSVTNKTNEAPVERGAVVIGQIKHDGLWKPHQFDIYNLMKHLNEYAGVTAGFNPEPVTLDSELIYNYPIVFMTGQFEFSYTKTQAENLKKFIEKGGFLFAEPCCGQKAFDVAFRAFISDVFPENNLKQIPLDDELFTIGYDIRRVKYRSAVVKKEPALDTPVLEGIKIGDRYGVIYSPFNFSIGLNGHPCPICWGYSPKDSLRVATNIVLYALNN